MLTDATADLAIALMLAVTRRLGEGERLLRSRTPWAWAIDFMLGRGLRGKTLGIVGYGEIGRAVADRARAFGIEVIYTRRSAGGVELPELLERSPEGSRVTVIATGGYTQEPWLRDVPGIDHVEPDLTLRGIRYAWERIAAGASTSGAHRGGTA